jgi:large subunit ribosomal protein L25
MKTVEIIGFKRANLGKSSSKESRDNGHVPAVMYGGKEQVHFEVPTILFKDIVYTPNAHLVDLNIEGSKHLCILQEVQFHPVNDMIIHADFMEVSDKKPVKMEVPLRLIGTAEGVLAGGKLVQKLRKIKVRALPKDLPDFVELEVSGLALGKSIRVGDIKSGSFDILNSKSVTVATIEIPRALKGKTGEAEG